MNERRVRRRGKAAQPAGTPAEPAAEPLPAEPLEVLPEEAAVADGPAPKAPAARRSRRQARAAEPDEEQTAAASDEAEPDETEHGEIEAELALELEHGAEPSPLPVGTTSSSVSLVPRGSLVPHDALSAYFQEISRYPLLTREEELSLAKRVHHDADRGAAQKLVLSNLRLVVKIAMEYRRVWTNVLDLIQEGTVGLLQAVRRFDPYRGVKLSSYSAYWIRAYILKYLIDNIRTVRMGSSRAERKIFYSLNRARRELERAGFTPTPALLAERLEVAPEDVEHVQRRLSQQDLSLDAPLTDDGGAATLGDRQSAPGRGVEEAVSEREMQQTFRRHIERFSAELDEREAIILRERMLADEPSTLQEIGDRFGLTRERVRQIEKKIVDRLRAYMKENLVDFDYWAPED